MAPKVLNLFKGHPTADLLPALEVLEASKVVLTEAAADPFKYLNSKDNTHPLSYGTDPGNLTTRTTIAEWNDGIFKRPAKTNPDCINLTGGASYGIFNLLAQTTSLYKDLTRQIFIVSPTYYLINGSFIDNGFGGKLTGINEFHDGELDLKTLQEQLEYHDSLAPIEKITPETIKHINDPSRVFKKIYRYVFYCIPTYSNPRGGTYTLETRLKLLELARKHDMLIVADDVYDLLDYETPLTEQPNPLPRLCYLDRDTCEPDSFGNTVSNATFSKLLGPGLRVGWQETATPKLAYQLSQGGSNKSGGTPAQLNTLIVEQIIASGKLDEIIAGLRTVYSQRSKVMIDSIKKYLPQGTEIDGGTGGYFVWVKTPDYIDCMKVVEKCGERGVILAGGNNFEVIGDEKQWGKTSVRLSLSYLNASQIEEAIGIWGEVIKELYP